MSKLLACFIIGFFVFIVNLINIKITDGCVIIEDVGESLMFGLGGFVLSALFLLGTLLNNSNVSNGENVFSTINIDTIKNSNEYILITDSSKNSDGELGSIKNFETDTFFIPWDNDNVVGFAVSKGFLSLSAKLYIYVPAGQYDNMVETLMIKEENRLDSYFTDPYEVLEKNPISPLASKSSEMFYVNGKSTSNEKTSTSDSYTTNLIESKPIFKYDLINGVYTIRYEDGTLLDVNKLVVEIKESNTNQMYVDKIEVTVPNINDENMSYYRYEIYK